MKDYLALCLQGEYTIKQRKEMLSAKYAELEKKISELNDCLKYIDWKQDFYDGILSGKIKYQSNLIKVD